MNLAEEEQHLADEAFEDARGENLNYWTMDKDDPEVKLWKSIWVKGFRKGIEEAARLRDLMNKA